MKHYYLQILPTHCKNAVSTLVITDKSLALPLEILVPWFQECRVPIIAYIMAASVTWRNHDAVIAQMCIGFLVDLSSILI